MADEEDAELILGTYEDFVVGYSVELNQVSASKRLKSNSSTNGGESNGKPKQFSLEQSFAVRGHSGSVTSVATSNDGSLAVSAGHDEVLNLFDLKRRKLLQTIEVAVKCAVFVGNKHLVCGSEDSNIYIYELKKSEMTLAKTLKGHKLPVTSLSVHPSGKVLLSISKDNTMRTWNLIKGRIAYVTQVKPDAHIVRWSMKGEEFLIAANNEIYLYNNSGSLEHSIKTDKRINSVEFITGNIFLVANETGSLEFFDLKLGASMMKFEAHSSRIKSVRFIRQDESGSKFATASSDGTIKLWTAESPGKTKPRELSSTDTGARLTCMASAVRKTA